MVSREFAEEAAHVRRRLAVLDVIATALDRFREVTETIASSDDRSSAIVAVGQLLGSDEDGARAVVDLQWARLARDMNGHIEYERLVRLRQLRYAEQGVPQNMRKQEWEWEQPVLRPPLSDVIGKSVEAVTKIYEQQGLVVQIIDLSISDEVTQERNVKRVRLYARGGKVERASQG